MATTILTPELLDQLLAGHAYDEDRRIAACARARRAL